MWPRGRLAAKTLIRGGDTVLGTHRLHGELGLIPPVEHEQAHRRERAA